LPSKKSALGACVLLLATVASASNKTYIVHKGDTVGTIAKKFHISEKALTSENSLGNKHLRSGMKLEIPSSSNGTVTYTIRNGDNDWVLAHHLGTSIAALRKLNPETDWRNLQIGDTLKVPGKANPEVPKFKSRYAVVAADGAIIRRSPNQTAEKVTQVNTGTKVTVLNFQHGWYQLKFPKGTVGWMRGDLLQECKPDKAVVAARVAAKRMVAAKHSKPVRVAARAKSAHKAAFVAKMPLPKNSVALLGASDGKGVPAIKNLVEKSTSGAVEPAVETTKVAAVAAAKPTIKKSVKAVAANYEPRGKASTSDLLNKAYRLRGTRYVYGGLTSRGLDCSGFTSTVFRSVGIKLPRTSRSQSTIGVAVPRGELRAGDLVFFRTHRSTRINHVGMYIGENKFIHASSGAGRVRVDNLDGYYGTRLATARRLATVKNGGQNPNTATEDPQRGRRKKKPSKKSKGTPTSEKATKPTKKSDLETGSEIDPQ
jgi:cell wall-associated NlpC family hydrolase/LysM repeat protein